MKNKENSMDNKIMFFFIRAFSFESLKFELAYELDQRRKITLNVEP